MNEKEYEKLLELPPQEYCERIYDLFPQNTGYAYKTETPFDECKSDDIVYIPERSYKELPIEITYYTKQDLISLCDDSHELAEYVLDSLEWQYPETYLEELCNNYTDIVIDYQADRIHANSVNETLWGMLTEEEQQHVLTDCNK